MVRSIRFCPFVEPVRDSSKEGRKTDNADTHHHLNIGFWPRWRVLRPYPLGSGGRGRHRAGDNIVDSPHRLHSWLVPLKVTTGDELRSRLPFSLLLSNIAHNGAGRESLFSPQPRALSRDFEELNILGKAKTIIPLVVRNRLFN